MVARETKENERNPLRREASWHLIDVSGQYVGRIATKIARLLMGKQKVTYTPHIDAGDYVVAINTDGLKISGKKADQKIYFHFSGYPGGLSRTPYKDLFKKDSGQVLRNAVWGMLPKNKLRDKKIKRLKLFRGGTHPHKDKF